MEHNNFSKDILNISDSSEEHEYFFNFYILMRDITGLILYPLVCLLGLPANILGILVMSMKEMRSSTTVFLIALAITDSVKIVVDLLYFVNVLAIKITPSGGRQLYAYLYPYTHYIFNATMMSTAWITVAIAVERYIAVCHAYKAKFLCTITQSTLLSLFIMVASFLLSTPYALRYEKSSTYQNETTEGLMVSPLWKHENFGDIFNWFHYAMRSLVPFTLLVLFSICIKYGLRSCRFGHKNRRVSACLLAVVVTFILCISPDTVMSTIFQTGYMEENYLARGIREITDFLVLTHTLINFVIYCIFNPQFPKALRKLFNCFPWLSTRRYSENRETIGLSEPRSRRATLDQLLP